MLEYIYGHDKVVADFVAQYIPECRERGFGKCTAIGVMEGGLLLAGLVYHNWEPEAQVIQISGAALPGHFWLTPSTLRHMYGYPFLQLGCQMVINNVPAEDERQLRQMAAFGYSLVRIPRMLGRNKDAVLGLLTVEDWRANKFNNRLQHRAEPLGKAA